MYLCMGPEGYWDPQGPNLSNCTSPWVNVITQKVRGPPQGDQLIDAHTHTHTLHAWQFTLVHFATMETPSTKVSFVSAPKNVIGQLMSSLPLAPGKEEEQSPLQT